MKHLIAFIFFLLATAGVQAADYCRCGPLSEASCVATTPDTPSEFTLNASADGTHVRFCRGGDWSDRTSGLGVLTPAACQPTCANKITFESYTAAWGGTNKPIVGCVNSCIFIVFGESESTVVNGGYVIQNLDFRGSALGATALYVQSQLSDMLITGNDFSDWDATFIELKEGNPSETTKKLRRIDILYNTFADATSGASVACIHGAAGDLWIKGNTFDRCGGCAGTCHSMYINPRNDARVTIEYNVMSRAGALIGGEASNNCQSGNISIRGMADQVTVRGNVINNSAAVPTWQCGGIQIKPAYCFECGGDLVGAAIWDAEFLHRVIVDGNTVINTGQLSGFELGAARYFRVENNLCLRTLADGANSGANACFDTPGGSINLTANYPDETDLGGTFRNNTCMMLAASDGATCFVWGTSHSAGTDLRMSNNIAYLASAQTGTQSCFRQPQLSDFTVWNNNICAGSWDRWSSTGSAGGGYANHAAAHAAGFDTWSASGGLADDDPLLTSPTSGNSWSVSVTSDSSPAHNNGSNTYKAKFDRLGCLRDSTPTIGAEERGGTGCQTSIGAPVLK